ncbi:MAG: DUF262 domain-containing HNH endonuclease family protein [Prevotellaceae bacterium]|jgi:uncharacterized protein with ParB-like and HNH nuclease domain|nr:DUF262 domain-containing HNH endonuclease family protein [Prevotellaceae bacterium]
MKGIQNTTTSNFGSLMGNGRKYIVPKFQRDYSWDTEQWDDLWQDITQMLEKQDEHYMGYLVLQTSNNKEHLIIDGQQRFTTITIIILAAIKAIKKLSEKGIDPDENDKRKEHLTYSYIGNIDPVSLDYDNTLVLNRHNDGYYKDYIVKLDDLRRTHISATEKLMKRCFEWYEHVLENRFATGGEYAKFIEEMSNSLFFTIITVSDEMNAFRVFETLNARGVQLSSSDLLKNYLFSLVEQKTSHQGKIDSLEEKWLNLTKNLGPEKLPDFLRYYWNSKHKTVRSNDLFKEVRKEIKAPEQVFSLMNDLLLYSDVFIALKEPMDEYWENDQDIIKYIRLLNLFRLRQPYSLLMAANKLLPVADFKKALKSVIFISFRYSIICGQNPNDIERAYNTVALNISETKTYNNKLLETVYINDREFAAAFTTKRFTINSHTTKIVRYILGEIERLSNGNIVDIDNDNNSIEHIMPQSPNNEWTVDDNKIDSLSSRLGNMCLLEKRFNLKASNNNFQIKKALYLQSIFQTTKEISDYDQWDENAIGSRQARMAQKAKGIWSLSF